MSRLQPASKVAQASCLSAFGVECLAEAKRSEDWWMFDVSHRVARSALRESTAWRAALYAASNPIQRTFGPKTGLLHHVQVNHGIATSCGQFECVC